MKKFMMAAFLGLFFLGARPVSADVVIGVPGVVVVDHHRHYYHHRHWHHHYHDGGPVLIVHP
jgi:hypothetical protein